MRRPINRKPANTMEMAGVAQVAKAMSTKDLKWQIDNQRKLGIPDNLNDAFKAELATRPDK